MRFSPHPTIQLFGTAIPKRYCIILVADKHRVMCEIKQTRLFTMILGKTADAPDECGDY